MLIKRHLNCPIIISNGYHCLTCARAKKCLTQRKAQLLKNCPPKRVKIKTTPKTKKKLVLLQKKNELLRKQKNSYKKKINLLTKNIETLKSKFKNMSFNNIEQKLIDMNYPAYQKTIVQEIFNAAKVICLLLIYINTLI